MEGTDGVLVRNEATAMNIREELAIEQKNGGFIREPKKLVSEPSTWLEWYRANS